MKPIRILLLNPDSVTGGFFEEVLNKQEQFQVTCLSSANANDTNLQADLFDLAILSDAFPHIQSKQFNQFLQKNLPILPVLLITQNYSERFALESIRQGFFDCLPVEISEEELLAIVSRASDRRRQLSDFVRLESRKGTKNLQSQLDKLQALQKISSQITSCLELDQVLRTVVDASVDFTQAEEGSLLLLEEKTGELYMHASKNFQEDFVKTFRIPVHDSLAGQVLNSGEPLFIESKKPQKIVSSYLVQSLIYVPLKIENQVIGILGVDNRNSSRTFSKDDLTLVSALADFAAIAIQNARLFTNIQVERNKLESILTNIEDGVIIVDTDDQLVLINRKARELFNIQEENPTGKRIKHILQHTELLEFLEENKHGSATRIEISLEDGRVFYAQLTPIEDIGSVITLQDITNLKELDRIKTDFVNSVSHDLRSPLTAILGYVELIERVGEINDLQKDFIHRVQVSVHNITSLINDLLDLGRIEAGFDTKKEIVPISPIIHYTIDSLRGRAQEKMQTLRIDEAGQSPYVLANPVRLRQMLTNLIVNSIKYTPSNGDILITVCAEKEQIIIQIKDTGQGIPNIDQPYIFDKFYRAGNVGPDVPGTGLGLAIVKSIVENHQGRIWVDSVINKGSTFTIVLPLIQNQL